MYAETFKEEAESRRCGTRKKGTRADLDFDSFERHAKSAQENIAFKTLLKLKYQIDHAKID